MIKARKFNSKELKFINGVLSGVDNFHESMIKTLTRHKIVIQKKEMDELEEVITHTKNVAKYAAFCFKKDHNIDDDDVEYGLYVAGLLRGTDLFGKALKDLLEHNGHLCPRVLSINLDVIRDQILDLVLSNLKMDEVYH